MATTTQEQLDSQAKEFADAWPSDDAATPSPAPERNPNAFLTVDEKAQMDAEAARAKKA